MDTNNTPLKIKLSAALPVALATGADKVRTFKGVANSGKPFGYGSYQTVVDLAQLSHKASVPVLLEHLRLTSGDAATVQGDVIPAEVVAVTETTLSVKSSKELTTSGNAEIKFVYSAVSANENKNTDLVAIGHERRGNGFVQHRNRCRGDD